MELAELMTQRMLLTGTVVCKDKMINAQFNTTEFNMHAISYEISFMKFLQDDDCS